MQYVNYAMGPSASWLTVLILAKIDQHDRFHKHQELQHVFLHLLPVTVSDCDIFVCPSFIQSGKFGNAPSSEAQESQPQGIQYAEDAAEHENMKAVLKSSLHGGDSGTSTVPGHRSRTRASNTRGLSQ